MINQLLLALQYTGLFALCLPSVFFVVSVTGLIRGSSDQIRKHYMELLIFWGGICAAEYLLALGVEYVWSAL